MATKMAFSSPPDGATHFDPVYPDNFYKKVNGEFEFYVGEDEWIQTSIMKKGLASGLLPISSWPNKEKKSSDEKLERLRDEFAMAMAPEVYREMMSQYSGRRNSIREDLIGKDWVLEIMNDAYELADAALRAREQSK